MTAKDGTRTAKPKRVLCLQLAAGLQLIGTLVALVAIAKAGLPDLPFTELLSGLAKPVVGFALLTALIVSLQGLVPRAERVAPALAATWLMFNVVLEFVTPTGPAPEAVRALMFDDVSAAGNQLGKWIVNVALLGVCLWFVISLFVHERTQEYLARRGAKSLRV